MRAGTVKPDHKEIRRRRNLLGLKQDELAHAAGFHKKNVENAEAGKPQTLSTLRKIAQALRCPVEDIVVDRSGRRRTDAKAAPAPAVGATFRLRGSAPPLGHRLIGREADLREIKRRLRAAVVHDAAGVVVVRGAPGVGKSSLLNRLARDPSLGEWFPDGGLWTAVGAAADLGGLLGTWGRALRISAARLARLDEAAAAIRAKLQHKRMLVLVDDVWTDAQVQALRVAGEGSVMLYTTRLAELAERLAPTPAGVYRLIGLDKPAGIELLASFTPEVVRDHRPACAELVENVEGLPLALAVAGKMLQREAAAGGDIKQLLRSIRDDARALLSQPVPPDMADLLDQTTPDVAAVLRRSTAALTPELKERFARLGAVAASPAKFPLFFAADTWSLTEKEAKKVARTFVDLGLLEVDGRGQYAIHPLMKALALHEWDVLYESRRK